MTYPYTYDILVSARGRRVTPPKGGDRMAVLEVLALLELLAVVVFGVIDVTKKK